MKNFIKTKFQILKNLFLGNTDNTKLNKTPFHSQFQNLSFAQEGEDMILARYFENKEKGVFIDVGSHHPYRFSNTFLFYMKGWRGINIDPLPESKILFDQYRPEDENYCVGISNSESTLTYYMFNEPALNTFDKSEASRKDGIDNGRYYIIDKISTLTQKLSKTLDNSKFDLSQIDFLSIDVEGFDIDVLESNDWEKYQPKMILIEELNTNITTVIEKSNIYKYLTSKGYNLYYKTVNTSFYVKN